MRIEPDSEYYIGAAIKQYEGLSQIFDAIDVGVCVIDLDYRIRYFNKKFQDLSGISLEDARGRLCTECFDSHYCGAENCHVKQFIESGSLNVKMLYPSCVKENSPYVVAPLALRDDDGHGVGVVNFYIENAEYTFALREYVELFEEVPVGIWEADYSGFKQYIDKLRDSGIENVEQYLSDNIDQLKEAFLSIKAIRVNKQFLKLGDNHSMEDAFRKINEGMLKNEEELKGLFLSNTMALMHGQTRFTYEQRIEVDGQEVFQRILIAVPPSSRKTFSKVYFVFLDITTLMQTQRELMRLKNNLDDIVTQRTNQLMAEVRRNREIAEELEHRLEVEHKLRQELEQTFEKQQLFVRALIHEIKTPLTPIIALSDVLVNSLTGTDLECAQTMNQGVLNLNRRIDDLTDLIRYDIKQFIVKFGEVDISKLVRDCVSFVTPRIEKRSQQITSCIPEGVIVQGDEDRLRQVVINILDNAIKFTPQGGKIDVAVEQNLLAVIIKITDSGIGIKEEKLNNIFEPYRRLRKNGVNASGLGLGLALSKRIIDLHHGLIWCRSSVGIGSTFFVSLPKKQRKEKDDA